MTRNGRAGRRTRGAGAGAGAGAGVAALALVSILALLLLPSPARADDPDLVAGFLRGRAIVERGAEAHGGLARFRALGVLRARLRDDWAFPARLLSPWPANPATGLAAFDFGTREARVKLDEPPGVVFGFDGAGGWIERGGARRTRGEEDAGYILRAVSYYLALPFRFLDHGASYRALGREEEAGRAYDVVEVLYEDASGRPGDRFTARYDAATGRLAWTENTARERSRLLLGTIRYEAYAEAEGVLWPTEIALALTRPARVPLHRISVSGIEAARDYDRALFEKPEMR